MKTPLVSIILPIYNREKLIVKALNSVLSQTYAHWECLVIDDGSEDATLEVLKAYRSKDLRINYYKRDRLPKGAPSCRNIGLEHAKGDYVIFLDSDDYLLPFCLEQRVKMFIEHVNCKFLVFPMGELKTEGVIKQKIPYYDDYLIPFLSANLPWSIMCPIWQRKFLMRLQGFTLGYPRFNDPELMIRALLEDNAHFKIFQNFEYDTVFIPSSKNEIVFIDKVFKSLMLFIPDISNYLKNKNKINLIKYLACYLHLWFKYIYIPSKRGNLKQSVQLINMFKRHDVITTLKSISLLGRLLIFTVSKLIFKKPINKITDKSLYI